MRRSPPAEWWAPPTTSRTSAGSRSYRKCSPSSNGCGAAVPTGAPKAGLRKMDPSARCLPPTRRPTARSAGSGTTRMGGTAAPSSARGPATAWKPCRTCTSATASTRCSRCPTATSRTAGTSATAQRGGRSRCFAGPTGAQPSERWTRGASSIGPVAWSRHTLETERVRTGSFAWLRRKTRRRSGCSTRRVASWSGHARAEERARRGGAPQPRDHSTFHSSWPPRSSFPAAERRTYATSP